MMKCECFVQINACFEFDGCYLLLDCITMRGGICNIHAHVHALVCLNVHRYEYIFKIRKRER